MSLLLSFLSLLVIPVLRENQHNTSGRYADWLRTQLGSVTSEAVEFAFAAALETEAENLDEFIATFVDAYTDASMDLEPAPITNVALFALLQHRHLLLDSAVTPHLLLKSALVRTLSSQARAGSAFENAFERANAARFDQLISTFFTHILPLFADGRAHPISPRAP